MLITALLLALAYSANLPLWEHLLTPLAQASNALPKRKETHLILPVPTISAALLAKDFPVYPIQMAQVQLRTATEITALQKGKETNHIHRALVKHARLKPMEQDPLRLVPMIPANHHALAIPVPLLLQVMALILHAQAILANLHPMEIHQIPQVQEITQDHLVLEVTVPQSQMAPLQIQAVQAQNVSLLALARLATLIPLTKIHHPSAMETSALHCQPVMEQILLAMVPPALPLAREHLVFRELMEQVQKVHAQETTAILPLMEILLSQDVLGSLA